MSTFLRMALTATLALSASLSLVGSKFVRAEIIQVADAIDVSQPKKTLSFATCCDSESVQRLSSTFDPEPNDPPKRTGGSGTR